jgi:hypothetical protein
MIMVVSEQEPAGVRMMIGKSGRHDHAVGGTTSARLAEVIVPREVDELLTREMSQLTFRDRTEIQEDIHGVRGIPTPETPAVVAESLARMSCALAGIAAKPAYDRAQTLPGSYVNDVDFRLRFLRCEEFDAPRAAARMVGFLDLLLEYFGLDALTRPVKLSDLSKKELDILREGQTMQCLPFRDRSGRRILTVVGDFGLRHDHDLRVRTRSLGSVSGRWSDAL